MHYIQCSQIPAHFALLLVLDRLGRKPVLGLSQILAGVTCIGAGLVTVDSLRWLQASSWTNLSFTTLHCF